MKNSCTSQKLDYIFLCLSRKLEQTENCNRIIYNFFCPTQQDGRSSRYVARNTIGRIFQFMLRIVNSEKSISHKLSAPGRFSHLELLKISCFESQKNNFGVRKSQMRNMENFYSFSDITKEARVFDDFRIGFKLR